MILTTVTLELRLVSLATDMNKKIQTTHEERVRGFGSA